MVFLKIDWPPVTLLLLVVNLSCQLLREVGKPRHIETSIEKLDNFGLSFYLYPGLEV